MYTGTMSGLGKGAGETAFDNGRAILWNEFVQLHAQIDPLMQSNQISGSQLASAAAQVVTLISRHKTLYAQAQAAGVSTAWLDPRFNDYEKPFEQYLNDLQARAAAAGVTAPTMQYAPDNSAPTQLIIQGGNVTPAGLPTSAGVSAGGGSGLFADLFGPPAPTAAPSAGFMGELGPYVPWIAGGLAVAYFLRKK